MLVTIYNIDWNSNHLNIQHIKLSLVFLCLLSASCFAHDHAVAKHHDPIYIVKSITLSQVIDLTLKKYPDQLINTALERRANALQQRSNNWLADTPNIAMRYQDDLLGDNIGSREIEVELALPLWNWGQRSAAQAVAEQAYNITEKQSSLIKLKVAGLVRNALWNMELANVRFQQAKLTMNIAEKLLSKIKLSVELGDLPRSDLLLAESDYLQKRTLLLQAEAKMMAVRRHYISLTQTSDIPADFKEPLSPFKIITKDHPKLSAINAEILAKKAALNWIKSTGSGQNSFILGGKSEKDHETADDIESLSVEISIPFGGSTHLAPEIALANLELTESLAQRAQLLRELNKNQHEAKHALQVTQAGLSIANELKQIAEAHLKTTRLSFSAGAINLLDLLKIQARSHHAIHYAQEHEIMLQKNIALYNQAIGVLP